MGCKSSTFRHFTLPQLNDAEQPALTRQVKSASLSGSTSFHTTLSSSETGHLTFNQKTRG